MIPPPPEASANGRRAWEVLHTGDGGARLRAFAELGNIAGPTWVVALVERALHDTQAANGLWDAWVSNAQALAQVEQALTEGRIAETRELRRLLARAHRPYFLPVLEQELASPQVGLVRLALEELEILSPRPIPPILRVLGKHENPSVAIKALYLLRRWET